MDIKSIEIKCGLHQPSSESDEYTTSNITNSEKSESLNQSENIDVPFQMTTSSKVIDEKEIENEYKEFQKLANDAEESVMADIDVEEGDDDVGKHLKDADEPTPFKQTDIPAQNIHPNKVSFDSENKNEKRMHKIQMKNTTLEDVPEEDSVDSKTRSSRTDKTYFAEREAALSSERNLSRDKRRSTLQSLRNTIKESLRGSIRSGDNPPLKRSLGNLETHFIDVGSLTFGSIFGLGEKLEHRVIMARTTVQCLMLPRFWLFEKHQNPGNIWQRRRFYLDSTIPSRQTLFKDFLATHQWQKFKKDLIQSHLNPNSTANPTRIQDVPIICRIVEASED